MFDRVTKLQAAIATIEGLANAHDQTKRTETIRALVSVLNPRAKSGETEGFRLLALQLLDSELRAANN